MAGVQIDGVNNKIDFDDDQDTSISANTDDTLVFEVAGATDFTMTANTFTAASGSTIAAQALTATTGAFTDSVTITTADNSNTLTLSSTDADANPGPVLNYYRNSGSAADNDYIGRNIFTFNNDAPEIDTALAQNIIMTDVSNGSEDVKYVHEQMTAGSIVDRFSISDTEAVFNEASIDSDFRVESNGNTHMLFVDGGNNRAGFVTTPDLGHVHIRVSDSGASVNTSHDTLVLEENGNSGISILSSTSNAGAICFGDSDNNCIAYINYDHATDGMQFGANNAERMRITSDGFFKFSTTGAYKATAQFHEFTNSSGSQQALYCRHLDSSNPYGLEVRFDAAAPDDNTHWAFNFSDTSAARFRVESDGDVQNHDNAYGSISDERIKQDIVDANSQWNDIKAVRVRNYKKKDDVRQYGDNAWSQIGVIAQELENVSPKLVKHSDPSPSDILSNAEFGTLYEDGDDIPEGKAIGDIKEVTEQVKSVKYSILYMKAIKALQEAMAKIEDLQARVTTLEG